MGHIDEAFAHEDQLGTMWDMKIIPGTTTLKNIEKMTFKVQDVNIPLYKLIAERKLTGELTWKGIEDLSELTITLRESPDFSTFKFFREWMDSVYDYEKRVFKTKAKADYFFYDVVIQFYNGMKAEDTQEYQNSLAFLARQSADITSINNKPTVSITYINCRILGIDTIALSYDGTPLIYTVTLLPEEYKHN